MEGRPETLWDCPQTISEKRITLLSKRMIKRSRHSLVVFGAWCFEKNRIIHSMAAAMTTRRVTMVRGGSSVTATPTKKNEPPQRKDRDRSIAQSLEPIVWLIIGCSYICSGEFLLLKRLSEGFFGFPRVT